MNWTLCWGGGRVGRVLCSSLVVSLHDRWSSSSFSNLKPLKHLKNFHLVTTSTTSRFNSYKTSNQICAVILVTLDLPSTKRNLQNNSRLIVTRTKVPKFRTGKPLAVAVVKNIPISTINTQNINFMRSIYEYYNKT